MAVVQYTFTHKQYTEQHNWQKQYIEQPNLQKQYIEQPNLQKQYIEQHNRQKQYIEQHTSLIRKSADRAPSLRGIPWHFHTTEEKARKNLSQGSRSMPVGTWKQKLLTINY